MNPVLLAAAFAVAAPLPRDAGPKADFFPLVAGNAWAYRVTSGPNTSEMAIAVSAAATKDGRTLATLKYDGGTSEEMASDAKGVYRPGADGTFDSPVRVLQYPLNPEAVWDSKLPLGGESVECRAVVRKAVEVEVPAGKFQAVEVDFVGKPNGLQRVTAWYADGVGVVKQTFDYGGGNTSTLELTKFTRGK